MLKLWKIFFQILHLNVSKLFKLVSIQCSIGFRNRTQWFITYIKHSVLIPTSALLNTHHSFSPPPNLPPLYQPSVCSLYLRVSYGLPLSLKLFFPLPFPHGLLLSLSSSTYEWNHRIFVFVWLTSLSIIHSSYIHIVASGKVLFFLIAE